MERIDSKTIYVVEHPGAVAIVAYDDEYVHLIRQPREPVDESNLLEIPAGKMDVPGESRLECARRELAEEVGLVAEDWREIRRFYTSPGLLTEVMSVFLATGLSRTGEVPESADPTEHLELVLWPLAKLDEAIEACQDAKTLVGLLELQRLIG